MPWYDGNIPTKWKTALEKKIGAKIALKAVLDPDGLNVELSGAHDIVSVSAVEQSRDMDINYSARPTIPDVSLIFNDPDNYFSPHNLASPFHQSEGILHTAAEATDTIIKLLPNSGTVFAAGEFLIIADDENSEIIEVADFTEGESYHSLEIDPGLVGSFGLGSHIWTEPIIGRQVVVSLVNLTESTDEEIVIFRGTIVREPERSLGQCKIIVSDSRKDQLDSIILGADSSSEKKLMSIGATGALQNSVRWENSFNIPPLVFSIRKGTLPDGISLDEDTGTLSGTPTTADDYEFTVRLTNADGDYLEQEIRVTILAAELNTEFIYELDLTGFEFTEDSGCKESHALTESDTLEVSWLSGNESYWGNIAGWGTDGEDPIMAQITKTAFQSGDLCVIARIDSSSWGNYSGSGQNYFAAIYVRRLGTGDDKGEIPGTSKDMYGFMIGYNNYNNKISCYDVVDDNRFNTASSVGTDLVFRIRKVSNIYYFAYKAPAGSWTEFESTKSATWAPGHVGVFYGKVGDSSSNYLAGSLDIDYLRYYTGSLAVVDSALPLTRIGDSYSHTMRASGGAGEYTWDVSVGTLPSGLSLNSSTGVISGTPVLDGTTNITLRVTDGASNTATAALSITVGDYSILPDILPIGAEDTAYEETFRTAIGGNLDREEITIGAQCPLGHWAITFGTLPAFEVETPGLGTFDGQTDEEFSIPDVITIPTAAWASGMASGEVVRFITARTWAQENPVQIIYDILTTIAGLSPKQLDASSFFGDIALGSVNDHDTGTEKILVAVTLPALLKAGEVLKLGSTPDEVAIVTGITRAGGFPPQIELTMDTTTTDYTGEAVTWKERTEPDTDFTFDAEYAAADDEGLSISISLDREMTIAQAIEAIGAHMQLFQFHHFGLESLHSFRTRTQAVVTKLTDAVLKDPLTIKSIELANFIIVKYSYNYFDEVFQKTYSHPKTDAENFSLKRFGTRRTVTVLAPGIYTDADAELLAQRIYHRSKSGIVPVVLNLDLRGVTFRIGELIDVDVDNPAISGRYEIIGKKLVTQRSKNVELTAYDRSAFEDYPEPPEA
jgi:hypothetical protein